MAIDAAYAEAVGAQAARADRKVYDVRVGTQVRVQVTSDRSAALGMGCSDVRQACADLGLDVTVTRVPASRQMYTKAQQDNTTEVMAGPALQREHVEKVHIHKTFVVPSSGYR